MIKTLLQNGKMLNNSLLTLRNMSNVGLFKFNNGGCIEIFNTEK